MIQSVNQNIFLEILNDAIFIIEDLFEQFF